MKIKLNKEQVSYLNGLEDTETKKQFLLDCFLQQCKNSFVSEPDPVVFTDGIFRTSNDEIIKWLNDFGTVSSQHYDDHKKAVDDLIVTGIAKIKTPTVGREKFDKFIEDNGLKKFTPPESKENLLKSDTTTDNNYDLTVNESSIILKELNDSINEFLLKNPNIISKRIKNNSHSIDLDSMSKEQSFDFFKICNNHRDKYGIVSDAFMNKKYTKEDLEKCFKEAQIENNHGVCKWRNFKHYMMFLNGEI